RSCRATTSGDGRGGWGAEAGGGDVGGHAVDDHLVRTREDLALPVDRRAAAGREHERDAGGGVDEIHFGRERARVAGGVVPADGDGAGDRPRRDVEGEAGGRPGDGERLGRDVAH